MTQSKSVGPVKIRPQVKNGAETGKWFVDVPSSLTSNGKRKRKLLDSRTEALSIARELRAQLDPVTGLLRVRHKASSIKVSDAIDGWLSDQQLRVETLKKRPGTLRVNEYRLRSVRRYFEGNDLATLSERRLVEYQAFRLKNGIKPVTINSELITLNMVFDWAIKAGFKVTKPTVERVPVKPTATLIPTPEEVVRIIQALPDFLKPLIRFLAETGCRKGEALNLTWDNVDEVGGYVEISSREGWTPKTQQSERRIPLNPSLLAEIRCLPKVSEYVFPGFKPDRPITNFKKRWVAAVKKAKIVRNGKTVHVTVQSLRKAHATWQAERGVTESVLQDLLGHAKGSAVTKRYYVQVSEEAKRNAVLSLPLEQCS